MTTVEEIKNLANLSRIDISEDEAVHLAQEVGSILGYISQITNTTGDMKRDVPALRNVMRDDIPTNLSSEYTEKLLNNVPAREGDYVKVKKILGGNSDDII